jgi:hypothetical protein
MDTINIRHKFNLLGQKTIVILLLLGGFISVNQQANAQRRNSAINLPTYDERWLHYGFIIGLHTSGYRVRYNELFTSAAMDSVHSIVTPSNFGFSLGFIVNFRLAQYLDFRILPKVSFYENRLEYNYTNRPQKIVPVENTIVEVPLVLKFKSQRRLNNRMYIVGGITPSIEATGKRQDVDDDDRLFLTNTNLAIEIGIGTDIYYELFKFSPEIRYSFGLRNLLGNEPNLNTVNLDRLTLHSLTFYLQFE